MLSYSRMDGVPGTSTYCTQFRMTLPQLTHSLRHSVSRLSPAAFCSTVLLNQENYVEWTEITDPEKCKAVRAVFSHHFLLLTVFSPQHLWTLVRTVRQFVDNGHYWPRPPRTPQQEAFLSLSLRNCFDPVKLVFNDNVRDGVQGGPLRCEISKCVCCNQRKQAIVEETVFSVLRCCRVKCRSSSKLPLY